MILFLFFSPLPTEAAAAVKASHNFFLSTNSIKRRRPQHEHNSINEDYPKAATSPHQNSTQRKNVKHMRENVFFPFFFLFKNLQASSSMLLLLHRTWQKILTPTSPI
jgi:hypothetical protein